MHIRTSPIIAAGCLVFLQPLAADTIALKDGNVIEGTIVREEGDHYVVEVDVSATIKDERRIAREDIKSIDKSKADEKAFDALGISVPTPDLLEKETYEEWISNLEQFLKNYPESPKAPDARAKLGILTAERDINAAGGIKFGGEMVSAEDYEANAYEYDVMIVEKRIKDAVARRDFLSALRMYSEYDEKFGQSVGSQGMKALILQVLEAYKASLAENLATLEKRMEKRKSGLASMSRDDRSRTERALEEQMQKIGRRYAKEKAAGMKWVTPDSFHKESMDEAMRQVDSELAKLRGLKESESPGMPLAEVYRVAWTTLAPEAGEAGDGTSDAGTDDGKTRAEGSDKEQKLAAEERKKRAEERKKQEEDRNKLEAEKKRKVLEDAKAHGLPEFYLEKLRIRAGLGGN